MKAVVYSEYGAPEVLRIEDVAKPIPKNREVLIRTVATTVTAGDWRLRSFKMPQGFGLLSRLIFGVFGPRQPILGSEIAGVIDSVGSEVTRFKVGDEVFAFDGFRMGCHAEFKCIAETGALALKPAGVSFHEAAAIPFGGSTALSFFRRGDLKAGEKVLVNGASGSVGTAAVQLARHLGAEVTGVCSTGNFDLVKSLGAKHVIDYTREDFTKNGQRYDVIMDVVGTAPYSRCKSSLSERGRLLLVLCGLPEMLQAPWVSMWGGRKVIAGPAAERAEDLRYLGELAESGEFKPVIERVFSFGEMADAHRLVDSGRKKGNVVIALD